METGDFDQAPAPIDHPSLTTPRSEQGNLTAAAAGISVSRVVAAFKHHLLKASASVPILVVRDLSAPPIASQAPPIKTPSLSSKLELDTSDSDPRQTAPMIPQQASSAHHGGEVAYSSPIRLIDRDHVGPSLHGNDMHAGVQQAGLLESADFCGNGVQSPGTRKFSSSTHPSSPVSDISMRSGEMHRVMSSGDISVTEVSVPIHRHKGHSIAVKVRPAFSYHPTHHPVVSGDHRGLDYRRSANKARPFSSGADDMEPLINREDDDDTIDGLDVTASEGEGRDGEHRGYGHRELSCPKVRPFTRTTDESVIRHRRFEASSSFAPENGGPASHAVGETGLMEANDQQELHIQHQVEQQSFGGSISLQRRDPTPSQRHIIHSPIPVSKVRPIFTTQPSSTSRHESHSSASKARPVAEAPSATGTLDKPYVLRESGQSLHS